MNRLGMLVDLSHVSPGDDGRRASRIATAPVIFSHSSARALTDVPRNVPDDILRELPKNGGVVMVTFVPGFVSQEVADWDKRETAERTRLTGTLGEQPGAITKALDEWRRANPAPKASLIQVADHIDHIRKVAGIDHIGLGSDFDGITSVPVGLEDVSTFPLLIAELLRRGYTDEDIRKIASRNILRVMRAAEATAAKIKAAGAGSGSAGDPRPVATPATSMDSTIPSSSPSATRRRPARRCSNRRSRRRRPAAETSGASSRIGWCGNSRTGRC